MVIRYAGYSLLIENFVFGYVKDHTVTGHYGQQSV